MPDVLILIPARMASTRLPGKPLADIAGEPMIVHVLRRAQEAAYRPGRGRDRFARDRRGGGESRRARGDDARRPRLGLRPHLRGACARPIRRRAPISSSTCRATCRRSSRPTSRRPLAPLADRPSISRTLAAEISRGDERTDPNVVKVVGTPVAPGRLRALYFTRATAPSGEGPLYHHIGLYAYRRAALERFVALPPSPLEQRERLEQLRALEAGMRIDVALVDQRAARRRHAGAILERRARCRVTS